MQNFLRHRCIDRHASQYPSTIVKPMDWGAVIPVLSTIQPTPDTRLCAGKFTLYYYYYYATLRANGRIVDGAENKDCRSRRHAKTNLFKSLLENFPLNRALSLLPVRPYVRT